MDTKFKIGQRWRTRNNRRIYTIVDISEDLISYPISASCCEIGEVAVFTSDGRQWVNSVTGGDLVKLLPKIQAEALAAPCTRGFGSEDIKPQPTSPDIHKVLHSKIHNPSHYTRHPSGIECKDVIIHFSAGISHAMKYLWRADEKHNDNGEADLRKARQWIEFEMQKRGFKL